MHWQVEMWEAITDALASLGPRGAPALQGTDGASVAPAAVSQVERMDEAQLVEYEGMLIAASAAQQRRRGPAAPCHHVSCSAVRDGGDFHGSI